MASFEALGQCLTQTGGHALSFLEYAQRFSNACCIFFLGTVLMWFFVWFFLVGLGGMRPGIPLFFVLAFFTLFVLMTGAANLLWKEAMTKPLGDQPFIIAGLGALALSMAAVIGLVLHRVFRRSYPAPFSPRRFTLFILLLIEAALAAWINDVARTASSARVHRIADEAVRATKILNVAGLAYFHGIAVWAGFAVTAGATALIFWRLSRTRIGLALWILLICAGAFAPLPWALSGPRSPQPPADTGAGSSHPIKHVVLITIDTLRQDALGCYSPGSGNTPHIDQLARVGTAFTNAFSSAPWTTPAIASIMTGMPPRVHQVVDIANILPDNLPTMAEYLKNAGYRTAAVGFNAFLAPRIKIDRGFEEYRWFPRQALAAKTFDFGLAQWLWAMPINTATSSAGALTNHAIDWFKGHAQQDSFFWVHYFEPHIPYAPPKEFWPTDPKQIAMGTQFSDLNRVRDGLFGRTEEERSWMRALYNGEVRYVDSQVGRLLDSLRDLGIYDDSLIVLTSDHGEEFWDHDRFEHGHSLYNELLRVPLMIKLPGEHPGVTADSYVSTQALLPTILDLCGVTPNRPQILPPPFSPLLHDPHAAFNEKPIVSGALLYFDQMESVVFDHMKYIRNEVSGHEMLFNLTEDPQERNSLTAQDADHLAKGRQLLDAATATAARLKELLGLGQGQTAPLDQQDMLSLKALGYL